MATAMPVPLPSKMTFEEFLVWGENVRAEWVDGEVEIMSPVSEEHQKLGGFLFPLLCFLVEEKQAGEVFDQTFVMRLAQPRSGREPDVMFVAAAHRDRIKANYLRVGHKSFGRFEIGILRDVSDMCQTGSLTERS